MKRAGFLNRQGRPLFLLLALLLLATFVPAPPPPPAAGPAVASLTAIPVLLDEADPARRFVGPLRYLRGWVLDSEDPRFGGMSAMQVIGRRVIAISDAGNLFAFDLPDGRPGRVAIVPLPHGSGDKSGRDTEAMLVRGDQAWIAFERRNAVARFRRSDWTAEAIAVPAAMRGWRGNSSAEAMARLADGRFLIFSEGRSGDSAYSPVALFRGDPAVRSTPAAALRYWRLRGFRITDAALLPDGRLLTLNRRVSWLGSVSVRLAIAATAGLRAGSTIEPVEIAELRSPLTVDNMEALSVSVEGGRTIVRIASDDNFMALQRTLLLEFELVPSSRRESGSRAEQARESR